MDRTGGFTRMANGAARLLLVATLARPIGAQVPDAAITGIVRDEAGQPLATAIVGLDTGSDAVSTRTDYQGRFRFPRVAAGTHIIRVVWLGYAPATQSVDVADSRVDIAITMHRLADVLPAVAVRGRRNGIDGIVTSAGQLAPLAGATVSVAGQRVTATSDSTGRFTIADLRAGPSVVLVAKDGYVTSFHTVNISADSVVPLGFVLDSLASDTQKRQALMLRDFEMRSQWNRNNAAIVPGGPHFDEAIGFDVLDGVRAVLNRDPSVQSKGLRVGLPCWFILRAPPFDPREEVGIIRIEAVEVYRMGSDYTGSLKGRMPIGGVRACQADPIGTAVLERGVNRRSLGMLPPEMTVGLGNVEVVVIWLRSYDSDRD